MIWLSSALALCLAAAAHAEGDTAKGCAAPPSSPLVVNVRDKGAKGDGKSDDTEVIQDAIDEVAGTGGTVLVPDGTYRVEAASSDHLKLKSNMTLKLAPNAVLKAFPSKSPNYSLLDIAEATNITVSGGTLEGERVEHKGKSGEGGMGIRILRGAKGITISGVTAKAMWGDGFYVKSASDVNSAPSPPRAIGARASRSSTPTISSSPIRCSATRTARGRAPASTWSRTGATRK